MPPHPRFLNPPSRHAQRLQDPSDPCSPSSSPSFLLPPFCKRVPRRVRTVMMKQARQFTTYWAFKGENSSPAPSLAILAGDCFPWARDLPEAAHYFPLRGRAQKRAQLSGSYVIIVLASQMPARLRGTSSDSIADKLINIP
jgi:hypothetical protein